MYTQLGTYIDGKWNYGNGGGGEDVINPATGKSLTHLPHASKSDLDAALAAAEKGFKVWKAKSAYDRGRIIKKAADLLRERADQVASSMTQEQGKVLAEAKGEAVEAPAEKPKGLPSGYEEMTVVEVAEGAKSWNRVLLAAALTYEREHSQRKGALSALESALAAKEES